MLHSARRHATTLRRAWFAASCALAVLGGNAVAAHAQCRTQGDLIDHEWHDPREPALRAALDSFFTAQQPLQGFSGVSLQVSPSALRPAVAVTAGRTALRDGAPLCRDTLFGIGSITKSFTSVLILKLEAEGRLDIHDTLGQWLPEYPAWSAITIEQLLNMTARTVDYLGTKTFQSDLVADIHRTFQPRELVAYAYPGLSPVKPVWHYSNTNYILAGMIVTRVTGLSYAEALRRWLFEPLHLTSAYYEPRVARPAILEASPSEYDNGSECEDDAGVPPPCAQQPLDVLLGRDVKSITLSVYGAAGGIIANLGDVTRWVRALFGETLLPPRQKSELFSIVSETTGQPIRATSAADSLGFGLGIAQARLPFTADEVWYYEGEPFGDRVAWLRRHDDGLVVAMGLNSSTTTHRDLIAPLYQATLKIFEPKNVIAGGGAPVSSIPGN